MPSRRPHTLMSSPSDAETGLSRHLARAARWAIGAEEGTGQAPPDERGRYLRELLPLVAAVALRRSEGRELGRRLLLRVAARAASLQAAEQRESQVYEELHALRVLIWAQAHPDDYRDGMEALEASIRIDRVLALAAKAARRGHSRPALETWGRWPDAVERLAEDCTPPL